MCGAVDETIQKSWSESRSTETAKLKRIRADIGDSDDASAGSAGSVDRNASPGDGVDALSDALEYVVVPGRPIVGSDEPNTSAETVISAQLVLLLARQANWAVADCCILRLHSARISTSTAGRAHQSAAALQKHICAAGCRSTILLVMFVLIEICTFCSGIGSPAGCRCAARAIEDQVTHQLGDSLRANDVGYGQPRMPNELPLPAHRPRNYPLRASGRLQQALKAICENLPFPSPCENLN